MNEWMKKESSRHQQALRAKEERRRERRELKRGQSLSQQQVQLRGDPSETSNNNVNNTTGNELEPHKNLTKTASGGSNKFLKIRSWREIYGTGEGKELARQQQQQQQMASSSASVSGGPGKLDGKTKSSRKSLTTAINDDAHDSDCIMPVVVVELPVPAPQPPPCGHEMVQSVVDQQHFPWVYDPPGGYEARDFHSPPPPPPVPPVPSAACSGAFMQEMDDDDEIFYELTDGGDAFALDGGNSNKKNTTESEEFVDHGLSYYHDPASAPHQLVPPPPPPPPPTAEYALDYSEASEQGVVNEIPMIIIYCPDEESFIPPPPPPPPPPFPFKAVVVDSESEYVEAPVLSRPPSTLLREIQLGGASLRHITVRFPSIGST